MATKRGMNVDLNSVFEGAASQFRGLNPNEPGQWPMLPKLMTWTGVALVMVVLGWFLLLTDAHNELDTERAKEPALKVDYRAKLAQADAVQEAADAKRDLVYDGARPEDIRAAKAIWDKANAGAERYIARMQGRA